MRTLLIALILLLPATTSAESPCTTQVYGDFTKELDWTCPMPNEDTVVPRMEIPNATVPLAKDAKAPFQGLLLDQQRVLQLGLRISGLRRLLWLELKSARDLKALEVARAIEVAKQDGQLLENRNKALEVRVDELTGELHAKGVWYRSWTFGFALGVALTTATAISVAVISN